MLCYVGNQSVFSTKSDVRISFKCHNAFLKIKPLIFVICHIALVYLVSVMRFVIYGNMLRAPGLQTSQMMNHRDYVWYQVYKKHTSIRQLSFEPYFLVSSVITLYLKMWQFSCLTSIWPFKHNPETMIRFQKCIFTFQSHFIIIKISHLKIVWVSTIQLIISASCVTVIKTS